jgi:predicted MPP superfamily phosphohydrolase
MSFLTHNDLRITRHTVPLENLPPAFHGFKLVQISDLHFYEYSDPHYYQHVMEAINALEADIIALTGDVVHYGSAHIELAASFLRTLNAPVKLAILGNHDYNDGNLSRKVSAMLTETGFTVLKNSNYMLEKNGQRLWFAGLDDLWYGRPDVRQALAGYPSTPQKVSTDALIVLVHNPLLFDPLAIVAPVPVDLVLAGHTHAGHVYIPFLGPIYRRIFRMKYRYGFFKKGQSLLYVTSGLGSAAFYFKKLKLGFPRFRFNTNPEIAVLALTCP